MLMACNFENNLKKKDDKNEMLNPINNMNYEYSYKTYLRHNNF